MCPSLPDETLSDGDGPPSSVTVPAGLVTGPFVLPPEAAAPTSSRYAELGVLGEGGMGKVHLCRDERIGREVAMKVILPDLQANTSIRARFIREASVQGQLEHPSIVPVHDLGVTPEGATFFTMKRVRGLTLEAVLTDLANEVLTTADRFTTRRLLAAFVNVCLAVDFAHSKGVVHRDLKPSNLMLGDFGEIYLLDWGIAKLADEEAGAAEGLVRQDVHVGQTPVTKTADGALLGTLAYMAPEQVLGKGASVQSDVFALGAVLFEILAGTPLREKDTTFVRLVKGKHDARFSVRCPDRQVAPELEAICVRATAVEPEQRFANARLLAEALERFLEGDRDVVRRRELAAAHVSKARGILSRATTSGEEPGEAGLMQELGSALALDPENVEARAMVVEALTAAPRELPREVRATVERRAREAVDEGARRWPAMLVAWVAFAPLLYWAGVKDILGIAVGVGLMAGATILGLVRARRGSGTALEYGSFCASALAMVVVGRAFGPFVLLPTMLATFTAALQLHPRRRARFFALGVGVAALVGSVLLELFGSYQHLTSASVAAPLVSGSISPRDLPMVFVMLLMNVVTTVMTALMVATVRAQLTRAEEKLLVHSWQVRGMMPANVAQRPSESRIPLSERASGARE
jgi:serine/threonine-protein kinase